jgi:hypothetical protein
MNECHQALRLMREKRYEEATRLLVALCSAAPEALDPWTFLGICLMAQDKPAEFFGLMELRQRQTNDGLKLFYNCLFFALTEWSDAAPILRICEQTPRDTLLHIVALFASGVIAAGRGDAEKGIAEIKRAQRMASGLAQHFVGDGYLQTVLSEGDVLEPAMRMAAIEAADRAQLIKQLGSVADQIEFHDGPRRAPTERFVFLSSCDERYLDRFGLTVAQALDNTGARTVYHLHIVYPTAEIGRKIERIRAACASVDIQYSTEQLGPDHHRGYQRASYYACSRLVRLPEILARYERDVFMWDMDTERVDDLRALVAAMEGYDLGYFEMKNTRPSLTCHLAAVYYANTAATRRLAELTAKYVLSKLADTSVWLLDQSSVFCASRYLQRQSPPLRINDFSRRPGGSFYDRVTVAGSSGEKQAMRRSAGLTDAPAARQDDAAAVAAR